MKALVAGGGPVGVFTAMALARRGLDVVLPTVIPDRPETVAGIARV